MNPLLHDLQKKQLVWRAASINQHKERVSTGYKRLDDALNGGFPTSGLIHIHSLVGLGEIRLVLPAIKDKTAHQLCAFIAPPFELNAEFLLAEGLNLENVMLIDTQDPQQALWSAEQCAKSGACAAIFIWHQKLSITQAKKLEVAALKGDCLGFLFESGKHTLNNLPVSLSMSLERASLRTSQPSLPLSSTDLSDKNDALDHQDDSTDEHQQLSIKVNKQKVGWPIPSFTVKVPFKAKLGSPMQNRRRARSNAANVYALHTKRN